ncbi:MAG: hypothetical protein ABSC37_19085, partial [Xanthobacteraceae bacterium]
RALNFASCFFLVFDILGPFSLLLGAKSHLSYCLILRGQHSHCAEICPTCCPPAREIPRWGLAIATTANVCTASRRCGDAAMTINSMAR